MVAKKRSCRKKRSGKIHLRTQKRSKRRSKTRSKRRSKKKYKGGMPIFKSLFSRSDNQKQKSNVPIEQLIEDTRNEWKKVREEISDIRTRERYSKDMKELKKERLRPLIEKRDNLKAKLEELKKQRPKQNALEKNVVRTMRNASQEMRRNTTARRNPTARRN